MSLSMLNSIYRFLCSLFRNGQATSHRPQYAPSNWAVDILEIARQIREKKNVYEPCQVLLSLAMHAECYYFLTWATEIDKKSEEAAASIGRRLVIVLKTALELVKLCEEKVGSSRDHSLPSLGEFVEIIDDFSRYATTMNKLIRFQKSDKGSGIQLFYDKVEQDRTVFLHRLDKFLCANKSAAANIPPLPQVAFNLLMKCGQLGSGSYAKVYKATWKGSKVAIKISHSADSQEGQKEDQNHEAKEVEKLQAFDSSHILRILGRSFDKRKCKSVLILELMDKDLQRLIDDQSQPGATQLSNSDKVEIILQIAKGMRHLHNMKVMHRDLKPPNILVKIKWEGETTYLVKIGDFGLCKGNFDTQNCHTERRGSGKYMAPEVKSGNQYSSSADVHSFGVTCTDMIPEPKTVSTTLADLVCRSTDSDPTVRPCFDQIFEELWIVMEELLTRATSIRQLIDPLYWDLGPTKEKVTEVKLNGDPVAGKTLEVHFKLAWFYCITYWKRCYNDGSEVIIEKVICRGPVEKTEHKYKVTSSDVNAEIKFECHIGKEYWSDHSGPCCTINQAE